MRTLCKLELFMLNTMLLTVTNVSIFMMMYIIFIKVC